MKILILTNIIVLKTKLLITVYIIQLKFMGKAQSYTLLSSRVQTNLLMLLITLL